MGNFLTRNARESDLPAIGRLMAELVESVDDQEGLDMSMVSENCRILLNDADSHILVAEMGKSVIGVISFAIRRTIIHSGKSGLIDEIVVTRDHRGKGIGKQLINAAVEKCRQLGCCEIEVSTEFTNTRAREFYRSCGFDEIAVFLEKDI